ncbi:unnamed protein product [Nezara viridula]|uniref:Uncharacterized protein n=1 Tax=Nezara viridula TaxID=85310 RepID=A0A9P0GWK7_NEZVI|nr:unnamed protein product [Nezara viridula]
MKWFSPFLLKFVDKIQLFFSAYLGLMSLTTRDQKAHSDLLGTDVKAICIPQPCSWFLLQNRQKRATILSEKLGVLRWAWTSPYDLQSFNIKLSVERLVHGSSPTPCQSNKSLKGDFRK